MSGHFHTLKIKEVRRETPFTVCISFEIPESIKSHFQYKAGQYLTFKKEINGEELRRSYSLCSAPHESEYSVAVKEVQDGRFSTFANRELKVGDELEVMDPMGNFVAQSAEGHHVAFAAGSGITPIISILKDVLNSSDSSKFTLFYGSKTYEQIIFNKELDELAEKYVGRFTVHYVLSQEQRAGFGFGRLDSARLDSVLGAGLDLGTIAEFHMCGPSEMIFDIRDSLLSKGIDGDKIRFELFTAPESTGDEAKSEPSPAPSSGAEITSTFIMDGEEVVVPVTSNDDTILDIGLSKGIDLPFACQGGVCCTCRAKVESGKVDMRQNFSLSEKEVEEGFVLTCQSYPIGQSVVLNYDA